MIEHIRERLKSSALSDIAMFESILPILPIKVIPYNISKFLFIETPEIDLPSALTARDSPNTHSD
jgi:hypothetical protein